LTPAATPWHALDLAIARVRLGRGEIDDIPGAAVEAMVAGADGARLAVLAGLAGASLSEIEAEVAKVYPSERGADAPGAAEAAELLATESVRRIAAGQASDVVATVRALAALWAQGGYPTGPLADLATFDDEYDLALEQIIDRSTAEVLDEFVALCRSTLRSGRPIAEGWREP
jgi:hypothetical protein